MTPPGIPLPDAQGTPGHGSRSGGVPQIADRLAALFAEALPLNPVLKPGAKPPSRALLLARTEAGLARFYAAARAERDAHRLGVIGQARVALGLQQRLLAAGYPAQQVKQVLFTMLAAAFVGKKG